nr:Uncharacterised protein [Klebsiella pneumoniae]
MKQGLPTGNPCEELKAEVNPGVSAVGQRVIAIAIFPCHINIAIASFDIQRGSTLRRTPALAST